MDIFDKVKNTTNKVLRALDLSIEELVKLEPNKLDDAIDQFDNEIDLLKQKIMDLKREIALIEDQLEVRRQTKKELIKKLKKKKF